MINDSVRKFPWKNEWLEAILHFYFEKLWEIQHKTAKNFLPICRLFNIIIIFIFYLVIFFLSLILGQKLSDVIYLWITSCSFVKEFSYAWINDNFFSCIFPAISYLSHTYTEKIIIIPFRHDENNHLYIAVRREKFFPFVGFLNHLFPFSYSSVFSLYFLLFYFILLYLKTVGFSSFVIMENKKA